MVFTQIVSLSNGKKANVPKLRFPGVTNDWKATLFSDIFDFLPNNTLSRVELSNNGIIRNIHYGDVLIKFGNVLSIKSDDIPFIKNADTLNNNLFLKNGDIVIADTAEDRSVGKVTEVCDIDTEKVVSGLHTIPCRTKKNFAPKFLGYYMNSPAYHNQLFPLMQGIKVLSISKSNIVDTIICYPDILEQIKIANLLSLIDKKISVQCQIVKALKKYKRGFLQQIFNTNLKYCNSNKCKEKSIYDVFTITRGYVLPVSKISPVKTSEYCYPVYSSQTKDDGLLGYYNEYLFENAITWTTDGANAGYTRFRKGKFYCTNVCGVLLNNNGFANEYVAEKINFVSRKYVSYVGNPKLMNNVMAEITIPFPDVETQKYYSEIIDKINIKLSISYNQCKMLELLKRYFLQQMFI